MLIVAISIGYLLGIYGWFALWVSRSRSRYGYISNDDVAELGIVALGWPVTGTAWLMLVLPMRAIARLIRDAHKAREAREEAAREQWILSSPRQPRD